MGMSTTYLSDGRTFWIAGEHEDYYDPDFFIYNDVIVRDADQNVRIYAYSEEAFPPTDFHTASPYRNESKLLLIGALDYPDNRKIGSTRVQSLDLDSLKITQIETKGRSPGWIHKHKASVDADGLGITVTGGQVYDGSTYLENIDDWHLSFSDWRWEQLTNRKWTRIEVQRKDQGWLHLFEYSSLKFNLEHRGLESPERSELAKKIGAVPDLNLYESLMVPSLAHEPFPIQESQGNEDDDVEDEEETRLPDCLMAGPYDDEWCSHRILVDGICVRFRNESRSIVVTIEGELPKEKVQGITKEMCARLAKLENSECELVWHRPEESSRNQ